MLEKIVERFCDSPTQYRCLLQTEKVVEKRALENRNDLSNVSLAEEFVQSQMAGEAILPLFFSLKIIGVFIGIQFLTYMLNIGVYYGFYCVTVVGGLISFIHFLRKNRRVEDIIDA